MVKSRLKNIVFDSDFLVMNTVRKTLSNINNIRDYVAQSFEGGKNKLKK